MITVFKSCVACSFLYIFDGFGADLLNLRSHGLDKIKIEHCINDSPFPFPLLPLTKGNSSPHCPYDGSYCKL